MHPLKKNKSVNIITLGCSKNLVDSEQLAGYLNSAGYDVRYDSGDFSDIAIVNTCGFIQDAKEESIDTILDFIRAKTENKVGKVIVMGCLSQRYAEELSKEIPEVDAFYGLDDIPRIARELFDDPKKTLIGERQISTPSHYAYLKIAEGCNRKCSFCAIPMIRGKHRSRPSDEIIREAEYLSNQGVKELILISQDLSFYGYDLNKRYQLPDLIRKLAEIEKLKWIRLQYLYPASFPFEILKITQENNKICKYIDIPIQHISDKILRSMRRGFSQKETIGLLNRIRKEVPEAAIRTTLITGYPGETESDFEALIEFIETFRFERLGAFTYSEEEGTQAAGLNDNIPQELKQERLERIMQLQETISLEKNQSLIGKKLNVLIDRFEGDFYVGRTQFDSPEVDNEVLIPRQNGMLETGRFYEVITTAAHPYDLTARLLT
ncbi:MAG: 30S ribosomal protein S12 methylthiotransferase RimO [Bacteroidales bacterium]|nr:30S ribosomal protein S12 methylthiotransferase RimO [Bacteroidales bacterium]MCF8344411.1 30S ribosomal protein S12 methylthiotransferase RimO [Bacteroidales bacterium]MCF8349617.1 30S ribosomal protein S12 methylthiotransferase RimO [Bacteroidales bacterium]MCF8376058.1 30S ribosomal protein S12 methylthiotransferase RimO [Bacteroidales bacterium]MCF8400409.1 30S ribosomal protein S12 methylthiotransferase RimO [Bacteroidales bacterium]